MSSIDSECKRRVCLSSQSKMQACTEAIALRCRPCTFALIKTNIIANLWTNASFSPQHPPLLIVIGILCGWVGVHLKTESINVCLSSMAECYHTFRLPPVMVTLTNRRVKTMRLYARPFGFFFFSCGSTCNFSVSQRCSG